MHSKLILSDGMKLVPNVTENLQNVTVTKTDPLWTVHHYVLIILTSLCVPFILSSNVMVVWSVTRFKRLQMPTNYFITSLAVTDIVIAVTLPFYVATEGVFNHITDEQVCLAANRVLMTAGGVSILTLATIAYDRYTALMNPLEYILLMTKKKIIILIFSSWVYSTIVSWTPALLGWHTEVKLPTHPCSMEILSVNVQILFMSALFGPACIVILFCYCRIYLIARHHARAIAAVETSLRHNLEMQFLKKDSKYAKTLAVVIGVFLFFWLPFQLCEIVEVLDAELVSPWVRNYLTLLAFLNSGVNPWVYAYQNNEFRAAYRKISKGWRCKRGMCKTKDDRRESIVSQLSFVQGTTGVARLSRANSRILASDILYVLSRKTGSEHIDSVLAQRLGPKLGAVSAVCTLPDLLKLYLRQNPSQIAEILEESLQEDSKIFDEPESKDSAFSSNSGSEEREGVDLYQNVHVASNSPAAHSSVVIVHEIAEDEV